MDGNSAALRHDPSLPVATTEVLSRSVSGFRPARRFSSSTVVCSAAVNVWSTPSNCMHALLSHRWQSSLAAYAKNGVLHAVVMCAHRDLDRGKACDAMGRAELQKPVNSPSNTLMHAMQLQVIRQ